MARFSRSNRHPGKTEASGAGEHPPITTENPIQSARGPRRSAVPLSVALLNKQSLGGAVAILLCALFFILVVPAISESIKEEDLTVGVPLAVGAELQVTPPPGWVLRESESGSGDVTTLTNSGAQLVITPATAATTSVADQIQALSDALADDPNNSWVVTPPTTFTTTAGDAGATATAQSKDTATQLWVISDGELHTTLVATAPIALSEDIPDSAHEIAASVKFTPEDQQ